MKDNTPSNVLYDWKNKNKFSKPKTTREYMHHRIIASFIPFILAFPLMLQPIVAQWSESDMYRKSEPRKSYPVPSSFFLWEREQNLQKFLSQHPEAYKTNTVHKKTLWPFTVGSTKTWNALDLTNQTTYQVSSTCKAFGQRCYVFVEDASWNAGRVDQNAVDSVEIYFDRKTLVDTSRGIYQMDVDAFGDPPDVDGDPKIIILLLDIKDTYSGSGGYVVGYFDPVNELEPSSHPTSNKAEIYYLDTYPLDLKGESGLQEGLSTTAHEFQHMIHFNYNKYNPSREPFINEGCSLVAEVNCGYPIYRQSGYIDETNYYLFGWRSVSDPNVLNDYSRAARFFTYIRDQVGIGVFRYIVSSTQNGVGCINDALAHYGSARFTDVLPNWFIANILNDTTVNSLYGYRYPHLPKAVSTEYFVPNTSGTNRSVERYAAQYYSFLGGSQLKATFTSGSSGVIVKAVEIGSGSKRVVNVPVNTEFSEPTFGTTYTQIHFAVMNTDGGNTATYSYSTSGSGGVATTTLSYAGSGMYYIALPHPLSNEKYAVRFTPDSSGQLFAVNVEINDGSDAIRGDGNLVVSAYQNKPGSVGGIPDTIQIGTSVSIPFSQLSNGWNTVYMQSAQASVQQGTDFHIVVEVQGADDTLQLLLDSGASPTNRTSSYRYGLNGLGWYNRADPNYGAGKTSSFENLLLKAIIASGTTDTIAPDTSSIIPLTFSLEQNYPNPFNAITQIRYRVASSTFVSLILYDILGREVMTLVNKYEDGGIKTVPCNATHLPSGIYLYRIRAGNYSVTKKMVLIK
jgi:hypothetical protein